MRILELLLPKGSSDRSLSPQVVRKIDTLQRRMDSYIDKIMSPNTSKAGKEFLKTKLKTDLEVLKATLPEAIRINEVLQDPEGWEWQLTDDDSATALFKVGGIPYKFSAILMNKPPKTWLIQFEIDDEKYDGDVTGVTGTGNASTVFSTVLSILSNFLRDYKGHVDKLKFTAAKLSRVKLYSHMVERLLPGSTMEFDGSTFMVTLPHAAEQEKQPISEAVTKLPLSTDDFELVKRFMEKPIPAVIAPIYIHQIIEDDELNDQLAALEESEPGRDVRPLIASWFDRVMPDQMYRFTGDVPNHAQKEGVLSIIHGYDSHEYKGENNPITGDAYGFR